MGQLALRIGLLVSVAAIPAWLVGAAAVAHAQSDDKGPVQLRPARPVTLFSNFNSGSVTNQARSPTAFSIGASKTITTIQTYHWNSGRGKVPGTIKLVASNGKTFGPWQASGDDGQGGVKNAFWTANPAVVVPAGTYTVVDSDPATWSNNSQSGYRGFALVMGR